MRDEGLAVNSLANLLLFQVNNLGYIYEGAEERRKTLYSFASLR
jgi:hypothetical protein